MKPFIFLSLLTLSISSYAQLKVNEPIPKTTIGEVKRSSSLIAQLYYNVGSPGDTTYVLTYNNYEYKIEADFQTVMFKGTRGTLDTLYNLMKAVFKPENAKNKEYSVSLKLGADNCKIGLTRQMGVTSLVFYGKTGYVYLTEKQVDKLFGKK